MNEDFIIGEIMKEKFEKTMIDFKNGALTLGDARERLFQIIYDALKETFGYED